MAKQEILLSPKSSGTRLTELLRAEEMDPLFLATANMYLREMNVFEIAKELDLREDRVSQILERDDVQKYIQNVMLSQGYLNPIRSLQIISSVIEQKLLNTENLSEKDLLDWIKELRAQRESIAPKKATPTVAVQVNNNLADLVKELM